MIETGEMHTIIPHRGKMLLLSRIISYDVMDKSMKAEYDITENCLFYDPNIGGVPTWAGFEFIAQAISAFSGIRDRELGLKPKIGFILSIPSMKIHTPVFDNGSTLDIRVKQFDKTDMIYTFDGEIYVNNKKTTEGKIMVLELKDEQHLMDLIEGRKRN